MTTSAEKDLVSLRTCSARVNIVGGVLASIIFVDFNMTMLPATDKLFSEGALHRYLWAGSNYIMMEVGEGRAGLEILVHGFVAARGAY
jgi:hypothetical protein